MRTARLLPMVLVSLVGVMACTSDLPTESAHVPGTVTLEEPGSPFIAFNLWVKVGSQNDPAGKEGLAALTSSLLADASTEQDSYQQIIEKLYPMATSYGSSVDKEMTVFRGVVHRDNLEGFYVLLRNALLEPAFLEQDFERVKKQTMNFLERGRRFSRDEELSKELLFWLAYRGTPYEHPEEGYVQSVASITLDDVRDFYRRYYTRSNVVVGIGGGYPEGFVERARADFDTLPEGTPGAVAAPQPVMPDGVQVLIVEKQTDATAISFGFPIQLRRNDDDFMAMELANSWFGEHRNSFSHLYQVIRERRGMNYGDYSYIEAFPLGYTTQSRPINVGRRSQLFEIWIRPISGTGPGTLHDRTLFATRAAWRELERLIDGGLPPDQVERTRTFLHNFSVTYGSTITRRLGFAVDDEFYGLERPGFLDGFRDQLAAVTPETIDSAIRRHLQSENMWVVFITQDAKALESKLLSGEPSPITYSGEQPDEVLAEDREIASFPISVSAEDIQIIDIMEVFEAPVEAAR